MGETPQDDDYFVQVNELYVKFKLVMKKMNESGSLDNSLNDEEEDNDKENVDQTEWVQVSQTLTDAILGCLDAKLEGLTSTDLHYYRLLAMKSSILVERSKILASMDEDDESFKVLDEALALMVGLPARAETAYVTLRLINHFAYMLSVEEQFARAKAVLLEGERVYAQVDEDAVHAGFLAADDLFMPECTAPAARAETADYLERLATNNMQMLGFVHGRLGDWTRFVSCGHVALRRQLERREGDALAWAARAARLAQNFLSHSQYREARTHLAAATQVLETYEADLRAVEPDEEVEAKMAEVELRAADIGRAWTKYALHMLDATSKDGSSRSSSPASSSSSSLGSEDGDLQTERSSGADLQERGDAADAADAGEAVEVAVDEEGDHKARGEKQDAPTEDLQQQGDVVVEVARDAKDAVQGVVDEEGDRKAPGARDKGDEVVEVARDAKDAVQGVVDEEGDRKAPGARDKVDEVDEGATKEVAGDQEAVEIVDVTSEDAVEEGDVDCCGLHVAAEEGSDDDGGDDDDYAFPTLDLRYIFDVVPCEPAESPEKTRALTQFAAAWSERVLAAYDAARHPELHATSVMDHGELLRHLALLEPVDDAYRLHRARSTLLEQACDALKAASPEAFEATCCDLYRELADVQLEMMTLNLRRLDAAGAECGLQEPAREAVVE